MSLIKRVEITALKNHILYTLVMLVDIIFI